MNIYIEAVTLAFWLGALLAIDVIETPARVTTGNVPRPYRFAIGARVFKWFAWAQVLFGVVLTSILLKTQTGGQQFYGGLIILLLTLLQALWIGPSMSNRMVVRVSQGNNVELDLRPGSTVFHSVYIGADAIKALLLVWLILREMTIGR